MAGRRIIGRAAAFCCALLFAGAAGAEVFRAEVEGKKVAIKLMQDGCASMQVRARLYDRLLDDRRFRRAETDWGGEFWEGCWAEVRGVVVVIWSDGSTMRPIPRNQFRDEAI
jgi:hypothetical protein